MALFAKALFATAVIGSGLVSTSGLALADDQHGVANVDDVQTIVPANVCGNDVPVNVLGVQVPIQDVAGNAPILSGAGSDDLPILGDLLGSDHDHGGHSGSKAGVEKSCGNPVKSAN